MEQRLYGYGGPRSPGFGPVIAAVRETIEAELPLKRLGHSIRVADTAKSLCEKYGLDADAGYLAGLAHDMCKNEGALEHGKAAALRLETEFGVHDKAVLEAVECHTTGRPGMGPLAQVVYVADKIEPGRPYVTQAYLAKLAHLSLSALVREVLGENIAYLETNGVKVFKGTYDLEKDLEKNAE
jgi:nicotinate-nucleotide adenylyltransferase